jgi:hypothetical protein
MKLTKEQWNKFYNILNELDESIEKGEIDFMDKFTNQSLDLVYGKHILALLMFLVQKGIL